MERGGPSILSVSHLPLENSPKMKNVSGIIFCISSFRQGGNYISV